MALTNCVSVSTAADTDTLIGGALARAQAVRSGRLTYQLTTQVQGPRARPSAAAPLKVFTFSDDLWSERDLSNTLVLVTRKEFSVRFEQTRQLDGRTQRVALVTPPMRYRERNDRDRRPYFAGTFWHQNQPDYVRANRDRVRLLEKSDHPELDAQACELEVPAADAASVFTFRTPRLRDGGRMRLYISESLGFALPLVEILANDGAVEITYESRDFVPFGNQLFVPRTCAMKLKAPSGHTETWSYSIVPEGINEEFPKSTFDIELPATTQIEDTRDPEQVDRFELETPARASALFGTEPPDEVPVRARWVLASLAVLAAAGVAWASWRLLKKS